MVAIAIAELRTSAYVGSSSPSEKLYLISSSASKRRTSGLTRSGASRKGLLDVLFEPNDVSASTGTSWNRAAVVILRPAMSIKYSVMVPTFPIDAGTEIWFHIVFRAEPRPPHAYLSWAQFCEQTVRVKMHIYSGANIFFQISVCRHFF
jgi:hypothetical protein